MPTVRENLLRVQQRIAAAAQRVGRDPNQIQLVAVTKTVLPDRIAEAAAGQVLVCGESRLQEAKAKIPLLSGRLRWQLIGHLQTNKARDAVALFELIHSVDSLKLAAELSKWAARAGKTQPILIEVNLAGEKSKFGLAPAVLATTLAEINQLPRLEVRGLMSVAPYLAEPEQVRPYFRQLRQLRDQLGLRELSMGMTHDFEIAVEEGATLVRVGSAIFGERQSHETAE